MRGAERNLRKGILFDNASTQARLVEAGHTKVKGSFQNIICQTASLGLPADTRAVLSPSHYLCRRNLSRRFIHHWSNTDKRYLRKNTSEIFTQQSLSSFRINLFEFVSTISSLSPWASIINDVSLKHKTFFINWVNVLFERTLNSIMN